MYNLFNKPLSVEIAKVSSSTFNYVKTQQRSNLDKVINYYKNSNYSVESDHLLVRLLQSLPVGNDIPLFQYRFMIMDKVDEMSSAFDLCSTTNYGHSLREGVFLGDDVEELIVLTSENFNTENIKGNWKNISALRFLSHPNVDLGLDPLDGKRENQKGPAVISINLPLLACQYKLWKDSVSNMEDIPTTMMFVSRYVLTNSLESYQNVSMFNIIYNLFSGIDVNDVEDSHPFYLNHFYDKTVEGFNKAVRGRLKRKESFAEFLQGISPMGKSTLREIIELPKIAPTRQVIWAFVIARLKVADMLLTWDVRTGGSLNKEELNKLKRVIKQLRSDKNISGMVSSDLKNYVEDFIEKEIKPAL